MGFNKNKTLRSYWSKRENDFVIAYPKKAYGWNLFALLESKDFEKFLETLEKHGFDKTTLKISCDLTPQKIIENENN